MRIFRIGEKEIIVIIIKIIKVDAVDTILYMYMPVITIINEWFNK